MGQVNVNPGGGGYRDDGAGVGAAPAAPWVAAARAPSAAPRRASP